MSLFRWRIQKFRMIRGIEKGTRRSILAGTLRPFPLPHDFERSLRRILRETETILIDPPGLPAPPNLDAEAADRTSRPPTPSVLDHLAPGAVSLLAKTVSPGCDRPATPPFACMVGVAPESHLRGILRGLPAPWALFAAWCDFLEARGWTERIEKQVLAVARQQGSEILHLGPPDEEARVLESIPEDAVLQFLRNPRDWESHARRILDCYLDGDLERTLRALRETLPAPPPEALRHRAELIVERELPDLEAGSVALFAPVALLPHLLEILESTGFAISRNPA